MTGKGVSKLVEAKTSKWMTLYLQGNILIESTIWELQKEH